MISLLDAAKRALRTNMALKKTETLLVVTNPEKEEIADAFIEAGEHMCKSAIKMVFPATERSGEEPPVTVAEAMRHADVVMAPTLRSLSHTKSRRNAVTAGARLASMPNISAEMMRRTFAADYTAIKRRTNRIADMIEGSDTIRLTTKMGTDITMKVGDRECHGRKGGLFVDKGTWGNLPEGEACFAPIEGTTEGRFVVDICMPPNTKPISTPITIIVKRGHAIKITGGKEAARVRKMIAPHGKKATNIAELGIGTNPEASRTGITLEDEKRFGTAHIALGNNMSFGGKVDVPVHIDGVFDRPSIWMDGRKVMEDGRLRI
ncbi:MAG: aminopeptidase [archaeon]